jgi:hypothetical protein
MGVGVTPVPYRDDRQGIWLEIQAISLASRSNGWPKYGNKEQTMRTPIAEHTFVLNDAEVCALLDALEFTVEEMIAETKSNGFDHSEVGGELYGVGAAPPGSKCCQSGNRAWL